MQEILRKPTLKPTVERTMRAIKYYKHLLPALYFIMLSFSASSQKGISLAVDHVKPLGELSFVYQPWLVTLKYA